MEHENRLNKVYPLYIPKYPDKTVNQQFSQQNFLGLNLSCASFLFLMIHYLFLLCKDRGMVEKEG